MPTIGYPLFRSHPNERDEDQLDRALLEWGTLSWAVVSEPAIALADKGFPVGRKLAATLQDASRMARMPDIRAYFWRPDGTPLKQGEILRNPELAQTLRAIENEYASLEPAILLMIEERRKQID